MRPKTENNLGMNNNRNMLKRSSLLVLAACLVMLFTSYGTAAGQTVQFTKLELKKNQVYQGHKQMQLHYSFNIKGVKGHRYRLYAYIYCTNKDIHKFSNGKQMFKTSDVISFNSNTTKGIKGWVGFYVNEMNPHSGTRTYNVEAFVKDLNTNKWIAHSKFLPFKMQGGTNNSPSRPTQPTQPTQPAQPQRVEVQQVCTKCYGSGFYHLSCFHQENDAQEVFCNACKTTHCSKCTDHRNCLACNGKGYSSYDGAACSSCNATGIHWDRTYCHHRTNGTTFIFCNVCKTKHCSECMQHDKCYICDGKGYTISYEYR